MAIQQSTKPNLCECGCGSPLPASLYKGRPRRFARGHNNRSNAVARFWAFVDKSHPSGCWLWVGSLTASGGYGQFSNDGGPVRAHRFSYQLANGPIADGLFVCHRCDVPACVNPAHLFLGTVADNQRDMCEKGRQPQGSKHGSSTLTEADVTAILGSSETTVVLAKRFGVNTQQISAIRRGAAWKHSYSEAQRQAHGAALREPAVQKITDIRNGRP